MEQEADAIAGDQFFGDGVQRVGPTDLLKLTVAAQQGPLQPVPGVVDEIQAELAFEAELTSIGLRVDVRSGPDEAITLVHYQLYLAAYRAVRADCADSLDGLVPFVFALHQRARGAYVYARAAELTTGLQQGCAL